jgi:hypothetical protein
MQVKAARLVSAVPVPRNSHASEHHERRADAGADGDEGDGGRDGGHAPRVGRIHGRAARRGRWVELVVV